MKKRALTMLPALVAAFAVAGGAAFAATTSLESLRVGTAGEGGVTFFNGSIVNEEGPVVIADDLRVDGEIYRLPGEENKPIKIADGVEVQDIMWDAKQTYKSIQPTEYEPEVYNDAYEQKGAYIRLTDDAALQTGVFYAPVELPHMSKVTAFGFNAKDNSGADDAGYVKSQLYRVNADGDMEEMAMATTATESDTADTTWVADASVENEMVDNNKYTYVVKTEMKVPANDYDQVYLRNAEVHYTTTAPY